MKYTQILINAYKTERKENLVASELQSLLLEPLLYSDICLVKCYHDGFFQEEMNWQMQCKDIFDRCSFVSHQQLFRFYHMNVKLEMMKEGVDDPLGFFDHFILSLALCNGEDQKLVDFQNGKAHMFLDKAFDSLFKHFKRWVTPKMLPLALLADKPMAMCVARLITGAPPAPVELKPDGGSEISIHSQAHKTSYLPSKFEVWLRRQYGEDENGIVDTSGFSDKARQAAYLLLSGTVDFRSTQCFQEQPLVQYVWGLNALPSNTQFVERGVKEAMLVSSTGRGEIQRTALTIIRGCIVLCDEINDDTKLPDRISHLLANGEEFIDKTLALQEKVGIEVYNAAHARAKQHLSHGGHYKHTREERVVDTIKGSAEANKPDNARQKTTGVESTADARGMKKYSKVTKSSHEIDLKIELEHRGFTGWEHPQDHPVIAKRGKKLLWSELKDALKALEVKRIQSDGGDDEAVKEARTIFVPLSGAEFKMNSK